MPLMYDSTVPSAIPLGVDLVAGYLNGRYAWTAAEWARWPAERQVTISIDGKADVGDVLDVELGDAPVGLCYQWVKLRQQAGLWRPTIYCNRSTWPSVILALGPQIGSTDFWIADPSDEAHWIPGAAATQFLWPKPGVGGWYDLSTTINGWPFRRPPQVKPPLDAWSGTVPAMHIVPPGEVQLSRSSPTQVVTVIPVPKPSTTLHDELQKLRQQGR